MIPLLLIPGHLCGPWLYPAAMIPPGFAPLPLPDTTVDDTMAAMAARALADAPERFAVAGLSMGGMVAMEIIARAPERVLGAALFDTDPTKARPREVAWRADLLRRGMDVYAETFVGRFFLHAPDSPLRAEVQARMSAVPEAIALRQARALDTRRDMAPLIGHYPGPVEIAVGVEDRVCPPLLHHPLAAALPAAQVTEIPGTGHLATVEAPDACGKILTGLASRILQTQRD